MNYNNPILPIDYSDPDVIRSGDDFFMVASSFGCVPGLPVLHSKDMVTWEIINYAVKSFTFPDYDKPKPGCGWWAPAIRVHDGVYYIFIPEPDKGIFVTHTTDPFGEWSPVHCIKEAKGWIDPCPLWDDDGNAYMVNAFAKSRAGFNSVLAVSKMTPDCTALIGDYKIVFDGTKNHPTIEGPKFYKRNGYYYISAPAGGVPTGWQTVLRSRDVFGPYEEKIVLAQGNTPINGPHQGAWVDLDNGDSWFYHFQDCDAAGRIVHMQPMRWENDWPVIGINQNENGVGEPVLTYRMPIPGAPSKTHQVNDTFTSDKLGLQWQWYANCPQGAYEMTGDALRLFARETYEGKLTAMASLLTQKFPKPVFTATVKVKAAPEVGCMAGVGVVGGVHSFFALEKTAEGLMLNQYKGSAEPAADALIASMPAPSSELYLKMDCDAFGINTFSYSVDGKEYVGFGEGFTTKKGYWMGAKVGLFAVRKTGNGISTADSVGYCDFMDFCATNLGVDS